MASLRTLPDLPEPRAPRGHGEAFSAALRIGDLAKATGKTARALRLYEEMGLLSPSTHTAGGFRVYGREAVERVRWITQLQDLGFTLNDIQDVVTLCATEHVPREAMGRVRGLFREKLDEVKAQMERLRSLERELLSALSYLESCAGCAAEREGPSTCRSCSEHEEAAPPLVKGLTETAVQKKGER